MKIQRIAMLTVLAAFAAGAASAQSDPYGPPGNQGPQGPQGRDRYGRDPPRQRPKPINSAYSGKVFGDPTIGPDSPPHVDRRSRRQVPNGVRFTGEGFPDSTTR